MAAIERVRQCDRAVLFFTEEQPIANQRFAIAEIMRRGPRAWSMREAVGRGAILFEAQGEIISGRDHHEHGACDEDAELCEFQRFVPGHWCPHCYICR